MFTKTTSVSSLFWNDAFKSIQQRSLNRQLLTGAGCVYTMTAEGAGRCRFSLGTHVSGPLELHFVKQHPFPERLGSPLLDEV